jgi:hypothetical protein
MCLKTSTFY